MSISTFRWGIFGTGAISAKFVAGLRTAQEAEAALVASRSADRARAFAASAGVSHSVGGYDVGAETAAARDVDAVYIATPASEHLNHALLCIEAGLPILVEKPLAATAEDARRIADAAAANGVFAMEAMWTRFLPAATLMRDRLLAGAIGDVRVVAGNFGLSQVPDVRSSMFDPGRGGGALSHLAPYPLSMAQWFFGSPTVVQATGSVGSTGVDETVAFQTRYRDDVTGSFFVSIRAWGPDELHLLGTEGMLKTLGSIVRPHGVGMTTESPIAADQAGFGLAARLRQHPLVHAAAQRVDRSRRGRGRRQPAHYSGNGYHYEADEVRACIARGDLESTVMPLADSISVAGTIDTIRAAVHGSRPDWSAP